MTYAVCTIYFDEKLYSLFVRLDSVMRILSIIFPQLPRLQINLIFILIQYKITKYFKIGVHFNYTNRRFNHIKSIKYLHLDASYRIFS